MITIELPWPDKRLSPNARVNRYVKAEAAAVARIEGSAAMRDTGLWGWMDMGHDFEAQYQFFPPDRRRRDMDNLLSQEKNYTDGVCEQLGVDDSRIKRIVLEWGEVVKGGKVVLTLEELE